MRRHTKLQKTDKTFLLVDLGHSDQQKTQNILGI